MVQRVVFTHDEVTGTALLEILLSAPEGRIQASLNQCGFLAGSKFYESYSGISRNKPGRLVSVPALMRVVASLIETPRPSAVWIVVTPLCHSRTERMSGATSSNLWWCWFYFFRIAILSRQVVNTWGNSRCKRVSLQTTRVRIVMEQHLGKFYICCFLQ